MPEWFCRASSTIHGFPPKARGNDSVVDLFGAWDAPYNKIYTTIFLAVMLANKGKPELFPYFYAAASLYVIN